MEQGAGSMEQGAWSMEHGAWSRGNVEPSSRRILLPEGHAQRSRGQRPRSGQVHITASKTGCEIVNHLGFPGIVTLRTRPICVWPSAKRSGVGTKSWGVTPGYDVHALQAKSRPRRETPVSLASRRYFSSLATRYSPLATPWLR